TPISTLSLHDALPIYPRRREVPTRILLADDHLIVRQGLKALLEREGFSVVAEVADGQEAIRSARERCPDVAVLDFGMPLLNGLGAAREILQACPRAKAILLTMHTEDHYALEALQAGVKGYVVNTQAAADLVRTRHTEGHYVLEALHAAGKADVGKTQAAADLSRAMQGVLRGMMYLGPGGWRAVVEAYLAKSGLSGDPVTARERGVLQLVAE